MTVCLKKKFNPDKLKYIEKYINTKVDIEKTIPFGFTSSIDQEGNSRIYTYGKRNIDKNLPFLPNSIYRMASQSKFVSVVGFLILMEKYNIDWNTQIEKYIPSYRNTKVINPTVPNYYIKLLLNPIYTKINSNIISIKHRDHPFKEGDYVSLEWDNGQLGNCDMELPTIHGIPGFELYNIHKIINVTGDGYNITLSTKANIDGYCGGKVIIKLVKSGTKRSICFSPDTYLINPKITTYYYEEIPLKRSPTILDIITHGLGWSYYGSAMLYMSFGYSRDPIKRNIQAGIWNELGIPVGLPRSCYKCDINTWARLASKVPLLFQPGEDWSYGPQISILGSIIQIIDGRRVEQFMKEELFDPLRMKDTGFFIKDEDPNYQDKINRLCQLYINMPKLVIKFMGEDILSEFPVIYEAQTCLYEGPRNLAFMDAGMYTTVNDYVEFMKLLLNDGKVGDKRLLSSDMINIIKTFQTCYDITNLSSVSSYSSALSVSLGGKSDIKRKKLLSGLKWGLGVGTMKGCKNNPYNNSNNIEQDMLGITWGGVLGTRFLIDFCSGVAFNVGTNVIGPPAGTFDTDLIELNYKSLDKDLFKKIILDSMI